MSGPFPNAAQLDALSIGRFNYLGAVVNPTRAPTSNDVQGVSGPFKPGQVWIWTNNSIYQLLGFTSNAGVLSANWVQLASSSGDILAVVGTMNQITASTTAGTVTLALANPLTTPGPASITGNLTLIGAGTGFVTVPTTASGAASGTVAANGRVVSVSFTSPSIAGGATLALTTSNTSITGSGTILLASLTGSTTGAALNIQSIVNSANQAVFTIENGTGATTQTGTITITYLVLN